jgi:hypothetical protein
MSIRFVYTPRFVGTALNATTRTLAMVKHAATRRLTVALSATRDQITIADYAASGSFGSAEYNGLTPDFYISTTGTGTAAGGGSVVDPWSISMLNNATARTRYAGTVIGIKDGTYGLYTILGLPSSGGFDTDRLLVSGGSVGGPTILVSQTPRGAIIDGQRDAIWAVNSVDWEHGLIGPLGDYVTFDGLHLTGANYRTITNYTNGGTNFTVKNCRFTDQSFITDNNSGANSSMFFTQGHDDVLIQNCRFEGSSAPSDGNRANNIQAYGTSFGLTVEYTTVIAGTLSTDLFHAKQGNVNDIILRNNFFDASDITQTTQAGAVIKWDAGGNSASVSAIHNNIIIASSTGRPAIWGESAGFSGTTDIYNNTFIGPFDATGGLLRMYNGTSTQIDFRNNIFHRTVSSGSEGDLDLPALSELGTFDYNLYGGTPALVVKYNSGGNTASSFAAWVTASSDEAHSAIDSDPEFVASGTEADYYALQPTSPAKTLGAGSTEVGAWGGGATQIGSDF